MAHSADQRDVAGRRRTHHLLIVKTIQVFERAAAPRHNDHIGARNWPVRRKGIQAENRRAHLRTAGLALHPHRPDQHMAGHAIGNAMQNIADHRAGGRGDDADHLRHIG